MKEEKIKINDLDLKDELFRISYFFSLDKLVLSIKSIGLIHPPLVTSRGSRLILVSGWKRILACLKLSFTSLPVRIVEEKNDLETFLVGFYENLSFREFSLLEKAEILRKLKQFGEKRQNIIKHYLPLLGIPSTSHHLDTFLIFSRFSQKLKKFIFTKNMSFTTLELLAGYTSKERKLLLPLLKPLGQNKQRELLEDLRDISIRDETPMEKIINLEEIRKILDSEKLFPFQKSNRIRQVLRIKRYPHLSSWKESFETSLKKLRWPKDVGIHPSPFFEEERMTVQFSFKDEREFKDHLIKLQGVASKKHFSTMCSRFSHE